MSGSSDKGDEKFTMDNWMLQLMTQHIGRSDMNKLIMNYLVTDCLIVAIRAAKAIHPLFGKKILSPRSVGPLGPSFFTISDDTGTFVVYLVRGICADRDRSKGFKEAAEKFSEESGIQPTVNLDSLDDRIRIRQAIMEGQITEAISMINSLYPELLDNERYLFFRLQQQELIELIKRKDLEGALDYAQIKLSERVEENPNVLPELERTLALLAFENPDNSPFGELFHPSQRQKVASEVNAAILESESTPRLTQLLKLLLWAQEELDKKKVSFPHITNIAEGTIESSQVLHERM